MRTRLLERRSIEWRERENRLVTNWNKRFQQLIERSGASERDDGDYESVKSANGDGEIRPGAGLATRWGGGLERVEEASFLFVPSLLMQS